MIIKCNHAAYPHHTCINQNPRNSLSPKQNDTSTEINQITNPISFDRRKVSYKQFGVDFSSRFSDRREAKEITAQGNPKKLNSFQK